MLKRVAVFGLFVGALLVGTSQAQAAQIVGSISMSSFILVPGNAVLYVDAAGAQTSIDTATGLDFTQTGALSAGPGLFFVNSVTGNFAVMGGTTGTMNDFMFNAPAITHYSNVPFLFQSGPNGFGFTANNVHIVNQGGGFLDLRGAGVFTLTGFDPTPGEFRWTSSATGGAFSFSATESTVPEPGSMVLLGTGLLGLGRAIRRRFAQ